MSLSDTKSKSVFTLPAVDKSDHRYLLTVKDFNNQAVACGRQDNFKCAIENYNNALKIDPTFSKAYRLLSRLLKSRSKHVAATDKQRLLTRKGD
jgi:Tfp pilus assembly protein PilF